MRDLVQGDIFIRCPQCNKGNIITLEAVQQFTKSGDVINFSCDCGFCKDTIIKRAGDDIGVFFKDSKVVQYNG